MKIMADRQRGFSFPGFLMTVVLVILVLIAAMKIVPAYITNNGIKSIFDTIVHDPEMQNASIKDVRESYYKRSHVNNIDIVDPKDIEISKNDGGLSLSVNYVVKIPLIANASLLLEFNTSNSAK